MSFKVGPDAEDEDDGGVLDGLIAARVGIVDSFTQCSTDVAYIWNQRRLVWGDSWSEL